MTLQEVKNRFDIVGNSASLNLAIETAMKVAPTEMTVLIQGESGVGKESFSKIIHQLSNRKHGPFIAINCGALPEGTINSELFGHEKGSFTGASEARKGYFETVSGGTIFLDEIGELPADTQARLLRILESGEFIKVGSSKPLHTDVRVVAATNKDLYQLASKGKFREDLYYRLNTVPIRVPSLKERREDIMILCRKFASDFAEKYKTTSIEFDEDSTLLMEHYSWPGNIRELRNAIEQLSVLSDKKLITAQDLTRIIPDIQRRNLPQINPEIGNENMSFQEREILYKLLFDMKQDLNQLKGMFFQLVQTNDLEMPEMTSHSNSLVNASMNNSWNAQMPVNQHDDDNRPIIMPKSNSEYQAVEEMLAEPLSIESMEKDMIQKALKKFNGKRKDAADELGISERTLYRKIKQYEIEY